MLEKTLAITGGIVGLVGIFVALAGVLFGVYQYYISQKWKKAEFAAAQLRRLTSEPVLHACCLILDWSKRPILIPDTYRYYPQEHKEQVIAHNWEDLSAAMRPETEQFKFTSQQALYRDLFDEFFTYLEDINHYLRIGLVEKNHVSSLEYWLEQIANPRFTGQPIFREFLRYYEYTGVFSLMDQLGVQYE